MTATKILPERFTLLREINLQKDTVLLFKLNFWGLFSLPLIGYVFLRIGVALHPKFYSPFEILTPQVSISVLILTLILGLLVTMLLHEFVHGIFFWIITRQLPKFGFRGAYTFAAAPDWYIRRDSYLLIGAAPLVILTTIGIFCIPIIPSPYLFAWLFCLLANVSGGVGDVYILDYLIRESATTMIQDRGDIISVYTEIAK
jgi:hypothetical protein